MKYRTIVADPPWQFENRTGKGSPEHRRLFRYKTMTLESICAMGPQVLEHVQEGAHLYLWVPCALLNHGLRVMASWGFDHHGQVDWVKVNKAGDVDRSGMGAYYRNAVEPALFGTLPGGAPLVQRHDQANVVLAPRGRHSAKPGAFFDLIERVSPGPYLELFARDTRDGWDRWGNEVTPSVLITTDLAAIQTWREVVKAALDCNCGQACLPDIYKAAEDSWKVRRAKDLGHKWKEQIRRTLQEHFFPEGRGKWKAA